MVTRAAQQNALLRDAAYGMASANREMVPGERNTIGDIDCTVSTHDGEMVEVSPHSPGPGSRSTRKRKKS